MVATYKILKTLFEFVLSEDLGFARSALHEELLNYNLSEAQFCNAVLDHSTVLKYDADQWFDFLTKVPNKILLSDMRILTKLTPRQRASLKINHLD